MSESTHRREWFVAQWALFALWGAAAAADMAHIRGGFFTSHVADITLPAWLYIVTRSTFGSSVSAVKRYLASSPFVAATALFVASAATEVSQYFWPHGVFSGTFDPLDIASYAAGLIVCAFADWRWPVPARAISQVGRRRLPSAIRQICKISPRGGRPDAGASGPPSS